MSKMTSERALKRRIIQALKRAGCVVIPQPASPMGVAGRADLLVCIPPRGRFGAVEVKGPTGRLSRLQSRWLESVRQAGGLVCVASSVEQVIRELLEVENGPTGTSA